ncbi:MAG: ACT domain protein [Candidatus Methanomethylophilaceae archaeon]|nr:ACT domain protein [Candidatus Methanomethylophilaceae archaeon]
MKMWDFRKMEGSRIAIDSDISEAVGMAEGSQVYSTLFKYEEGNAKKYELILSTYAPENYRTLSQITFYMRDVPGSTAQAAKFLGDRGINILNSVSMNVISDVGIVWKMLVDLGFTGEIDLIREGFQELARRNDPSISKLDHIEVQSSDIGRIFSRSIHSGLGGKMEQMRGGPMPLRDGGFDLSGDYSQYLDELRDCTAMVVAVPESWLLSVTFLRKGSHLVGMRFSIPDSPGSIYRVTQALSDLDINLVSVFTKVVISYEKMAMEIVADAGGYAGGMAELQREIESALVYLNGPYALEKFSEV